MTCFEVREYLFAFLDGELDAPLSIELQRHLEHCPRCAREAEIERTIRRRLGAALHPQDAPPPRQALERVMARVSFAKRPTGRSIWRRVSVGVRRVGPAGAALVVVIGGWFAFHGRPKSEGNRRFADLLVADFEHFLETGRALELRSSDPREASAWLQERTQVAAALPVMHHGRCKLLGARSCKVSGRDAAFAFYEIDGEPASLVAIPGSEADLLDMQRVSADGHGHWVDRCKGHTVVACKHDELVYAAVSKLDEVRLLELMPGAAGHGGRP